MGQVEHRQKPEGHGSDIVTVKMLGDELLRKAKAQVQAIAGEDSWRLPVSGPHRWSSQV